MATYYVSTTGNDTTGDGAIGNPWLTITKGQSMLSPGDTLLVRAGRYYETLAISVQGTEGNTVTIQSYPEEEVILDGTESVTGWTQCASDEPFLTVKGVTNPNYANIYKAKIPVSLLPTIRSDTADNRAKDYKKFKLFENSIHCRIARNPDQTLGYGINAREFQAVTEEAFGVKDRLIDSTNLTQVDDYWVGNGTDDVWVDILLTNYNNNLNRRLVASNSQADTTIFFDRDLTATISKGTYYDSYAIANHPHILDTPGEFAHTTIPENIGGVDYYWFYLWPLDAENLSDKISIPSKENAVLAYNKSYVTIDRLKVIGYTGHGIFWRLNPGSGTQTNIHIINCTVEDCGSSGIYLQFADYSSIQDCVINRVGDRGAFINTGTRGLIKGCDISDTSGTNMSFYTMTYGSMIGNTLRGSSGVHGNGSSCYINCSYLLIACNDYRKTNLAIQDIHNAVIFGNTFNGLGEMLSIVTTWPSGYLGTGGAHLYLHNTILGSSNNNSLPLFGQNEDTYPQTYVINNVIDGIGAVKDYGDGLGWRWMRGIEEISYNLYTGYLWTQKSSHGWTLQTGEIDGRTVPLTSLFLDPDAESETESYAPKEGSPIIGAGKNVSALLTTLGVTEWFPDFDFTKDAAGNAWAETPSMGAYEYQGEGQTPPIYALASSVTGTGSISDGAVSWESRSQTYEENTEVELTAVEDLYSLFSGWSGDASGTARTITVTMDEAKTIVATFATSIRKTKTVKFGDKFLFLTTKHLES